MPQSKDRPDEELAQKFLRETNSDTDALVVYIYENEPRLVQDQEQVPDKKMTSIEESGGIFV